MTKLAGGATPLVMLYSRYPAVQSLNGFFVLPGSISI